MAILSTPETAEMERAIAALALEIPAEVWADVRDKWHAARDSLAAQIEQAGIAGRRSAGYHGPPDADGRQT